MMNEPGSDVDFIGESRPYNQIGTLENVEHGLNRMVCLMEKVLIIIIILRNIIWDIIHCT